MAPLAAQQHDVLIVGGGFGGIGMAIMLKRAGVDDFRILERGPEVGGVWRDNIYPGAACDVPSHLYSFSFEPNPDWSRRFASQDEIHAYLRHCVDRYGLAQHLRCNAEIAEAAFDEEAGLWRVRLRDGLELAARILITATGQLSNPALPQIDGLASFRGTAFHSARWDHGVDLTGKRVAVIGTGASATQFVPAIAARVRSDALPGADADHGPRRPRPEYRMEGRRLELPGIDCAGLSELLHAVRPEHQPRPQLHRLHAGEPVRARAAGA
jgi:cation diffusion facilitator CzcD-associated flavoprotein CzcO